LIKTRAPLGLVLMVASMEVLGAHEERKIRASSKEQ